MPFSNRRPMRGNAPWATKAVETGVGRGTMGARNRVAAMIAVRHRRFVLCCCGVVERSLCLESSQIPKGRQMERSSFCSTLPVLRGSPTATRFPPIGGSHMPGLAAQAVLGPASLAMAAHCMENAVACNVSGQARVEVRLRKAHVAVAKKVSTRIRGQPA